jgi:predicted CoA-binding protein
MKKTLIIGASSNPERYSNKAYFMLSAHNFETELLGNKQDFIGSKSIKNQWSDLDLTNVHTVTMYVGAKNQSDYYQKILDLNPQRVIFNPGTENPEFYSLLSEKGINFEEACTLVLLQTGQF